MKLQLFAVLLVVAGAYAVPRANDVGEPSITRNTVEFRIRSFVEQTSMRIKRAGLDPLEAEGKDIELNLEKLNIALKAFVGNVRFTGASDIRINNLEYSYLFNRLRLDISLPEVSLTVGDSGLEVVLCDKEIEGHLKGSISIKSIRVAGEGFVNVNIIGGITLRSVSLDFSVGGVESDLTVVAQGSDRSEVVNNRLNNVIPEFLEENKDAINGALEDILSAILNTIWSF